MEVQLDKALYLQEENIMKENFVLPPGDTDIETSAVSFPYELNGVSIC